MGKGRLEAFSDGVFAIIITIMVLELKVPAGGELSSLKPLIPVMFSYILSFIYIGIYWNNHHHLMQAAKSVSGTILWANMHLLFWLSLIPFVTSWMGQNHFSRWPVILYGFILFMNAVAYSILSNCLIHRHGKQSPLALAVGDGKKGKLSVAVYLAAILLSFISSWIGFVLYIVVACIWFIPDRRIENKLKDEED